MPKTKQKQARVSNIPPLPAWARKEISKLSREAGMTVERISGIVVKLGVEAARNYLEDTINLISSIDKGPDQDEAPASSSDVPSEIESGALEFAPENLNGSAVQESEGIEAGSDNASERRAEPTAGGSNDFVDALAARPEPGGIENAV